MKPTMSVIFCLQGKTYFNPVELLFVPPIGSEITMSGEGEVVNRYKVVGHNWQVQLKSDFSRVVLGIDEVYVHMELLK